MQFPKLPKKTTEVSSLGLQVNYESDFDAFYQHLFSSNENALLLESVTADEKKNLKSILLIDPAVSFCCHQQQVKINVCSNNGTAIIDILTKHLPHQIKSIDNQQYIVEFTAPDTLLEEQIRLRQQNSFSLLRFVQKNLQATSNEPFSVFLAGLISYDMLANFETIAKLPVADNNAPDYLFLLAETMLVVDHQKKSAKIIANLFGGDKVAKNAQKLIGRLMQLQDIINNPQAIQPKSKLSKSAVKVDISDNEFANQVQEMKKKISAGEIYQIVLSRTFSLSCDDPLAAYFRLRKNNPSPYMFYFKTNDFTLFGASPESALKYNAKTNIVELCPIAGTRKRANKEDKTIDIDYDNRIELELRRDVKENAEHIMLVDLARNDIARISKTGSRYVKDFMQVDRYSHVMHLVSRVVGELSPDLDALHAYQACMNMGTLTGAPKIRASQIIGSVEKKRRGSYGGAIGYWLGNGDFDSCIVIRAAFIKEQTAYIQAGCGIVYDSDPKAEVQETQNKAQAVINAFINN